MPNGVLPRPSDLTREAVVGGGYQYLYLYARALPPAIDDLTADLGDDLYERMAVDPQVSACLAVFKASILEEGAAFAPAIDDASDGDYELAKQISDEFERVWDDLNESPDDVLWNLLDACALGNKIAEQVYELRPRTTDGKASLQLASLKVKPRHAYVFVVDQFVNTVGILARTRGLPGPNISGWTIDPQNPPPNLIQTQKFAIVTFRPRDNDPRGTSILRPAYDAWWRKRQALVEFVKFLAQFAGPSIWATTPEGAQTAPPLDYLGNTVPYVAPSETDPLGNAQPVPSAPLTPEQDLLAKLQQFRNGTVGAFPFGTELHTIEMNGEGRAFLTAIAECNMSITKAILTQTLTTEEGEHQARAAAQVHQDVLDTLVRQGKRSIVRMMQKQILRPWVAYNWGDDVAAKLTPKVSLGTTEEQDLVPTMNAIANLYQAGYIDVSQQPDIDDMLGLPVRDLSIADEPTIEEDSGSPPQAAGQPGGALPSSPPGNAQPQDQQQRPSNPNRVAVRGHERNRPIRRAVDAVQP
jgi:hypothetical protein